MEDVKFHQCVRLSRFDTDRTISFIPPDGDFELMSYRLNTEVKPLIWVESVVESYGTRIEYMIKVRIFFFFFFFLPFLGLTNFFLFLSTQARAQFKKRSLANNVEIWVPVPEDADSPKFKSTDGTVRYAPEKNCIVWSIKQFPGGKEFLMRAHFGLPSVRKGLKVSSFARGHVVVADFFSSIFFPSFSFFFRRPRQEASHLR